MVIHSAGMVHFVNTKLPEKHVFLMDMIAAIEHHTTRVSMRLLNSTYTQLVLDYKVVGSDEQYETVGYNYILFNSLISFQDRE